MADETGREQVGSVAEEAARLLDALGGWAESAGAAAGWAAAGAGAPPRPAAAEAPVESHGPDTEPAIKPATEPATKPDTEPATEASAGEPEGAAGRCEHCGAESGVGRAATCQLCPVCQGIALLRSVRPETVDRLADLAAALSATLRALAADRAGATSSRATAPRPADGNEPGTRVHDIPVAEAGGDPPTSADTDPAEPATRGARPR